MSSSFYQGNPCKASSPIILKSPDGGKYLYMVLPVRLRAEKKEDM